MELRRASMLQSTRWSLACPNRPSHRRRVHRASALAWNLRDGVSIYHPPRTLAGTFVLHSDEAAMQRQVVPDGILSQQTTQNHERQFSEWKKNRKEVADRATKHYVLWPWSLDIQFENAHRIWTGIPLLCQNLTVFMSPTLYSQRGCLQLSQLVCCSEFI